MYISVGITNPEMLMEKIQPKKHDSCFAPHVQTIKQASTARRQTAWMKALYQKKKTQSYSSAGFTMGTEYLLDSFLSFSNSKHVFLKKL